MSSLNHTLTDSATMLRRNLRHMLRYPSMTVLLAGMPVVFLLLFVYVFGGAIGNGLGPTSGAGGGAGGGRGEYIVYVMPGILLMTVAAVAQGTAVSVAMDMTEGIISRFRTMSISRASVLTGHVVGSLVQTVIAMVIVVAVALVIGFRSDATPVEWLAALGILGMIAFAVIWLSVALGLVSKTVEGASNLPMPLTLLPFLGSGFVPTDSMPTGLRWFAEYQPFTPVMETLRGLLTGTPIGNNAALTAAWSTTIALLAYLWARKLYNRDPGQS
ncbi:ABC transporter permease [Streptomyces sp. NPDC057137]|uniref:ABC transporter permease n=1 Tax=Streptomyces sp. NPDC057137 TaxID=3346030 RepID=UPI0036298447